MTQEDKDLLLKDLCARLPYGVKVLCLRDFNHKWYNLERIDIRDNEAYLTTKTFGSYLNKYVGIEVVKPYLFPLSSMTDEQRKELEELYLGCYVTCQDIDDDGYIWDENVFEMFPGTETDDWLNAHHFDYRGLIPKGLAIDATGLNIY